MAKKGLDGTALDVPDHIVPDQPGSTDAEVKNLLFDKGLRFIHLIHCLTFHLTKTLLKININNNLTYLYRYCMDTFVDPMDWRRKGLETCYEYTPFIIFIILFE